MKTSPNLFNKGFTLIEVIITLVIIAVFAAMMGTYFSSSITQSSNPIFRLRAASQLNNVLEQMAAAYSGHQQWKPGTTYAVGSIVIPPVKTRTGVIYEATSAGTSGSAIPDWLQTPITDNTVTWTTHAAAPRLIDDQSWIANKNYKKYDVIVQGSYQYVREHIGTSGASAPAWPANPIVGQIVIDNSFNWICSGPGPTSATLKLHTAIGSEGVDQDNAYGRYHVIHNRFIRFDNSTSPQTEVNLTGNTAHVDYGKFLKVTIKMHTGDADATGETLTTLFVIR